ncbi:MAG TPA: cysteine rich repeat-containing protein [Methylovirgula sp.]
MTRFLACLVLLAAMCASAHADDKLEARKKACHDDYHAFCSTVMPGGNRIVECLMAHKDKLSAGCRTAVGL